MLTEKILLTHSITAATDLDDASRFIGLDGDYCGAGERAAGVLAVSTKQGQQAPVKMSGLLLVEAGGQITAGKRVVSDALGRAVQAADLSAETAIPEGSTDVTSDKAQPDLDIVLAGSELPEVTNGWAYTAASAEGDFILVKTE